MPSADQSELSRGEIARRIKAARILRNISQRELQEQLHEAGLGSTELGRLERGSLKEPITGVQRRELSRALRVPERWFTNPSVDEIVGYPRDAVDVNALFPNSS